MNLFDFRHMTTAEPQAYKEERAIQENSFVFVDGKGLISVAEAEATVGLPYITQHFKRQRERTTDEPQQR